MSQKNKGKWSHQDAFADENKAEAKIFASLTADKHAHRWLNTLNAWWNWR